MRTSFLISVLVGVSRSRHSNGGSGRGGGSGWSGGGGGRGIVMCNVVVFLSLLPDWSDLERELFLPIAFATIGCFPGPRTVSLHISLNTVVVVVVVVVVGMRL